MSFRARLFIFFVLIVVVPIVAMGVLMFRLINDSQQGKADARAGGLAAAAASVYQAESGLARGDAETLARALGPLRGSALTARFSALARQAGLARARLTVGSRTLADEGDRTAIAPGEAMLVQSGARRRMLVTVSELTASQYARELTAPGVAIVVREGRRVLGASLPAAQAASLDDAGKVTVDGRGYRAVGQDFPAFGHTRVTVAVLSALSATSATLAGSRAVAAVLIIAFLLLAFAFSMLASPRM